MHGVAAGATAQWIAATKVRVYGHIRMCDEEPECTNHEKLAAAIKENMSTHDVVIVEGSKLVHHAEVTALIGHTTPS